MKLSDPKRTECSLSTLGYAAPFAGMRMRGALRLGVGMLLLLLAVTVATGLGAYWGYRQWAGTAPAAGQAADSAKGQGVREGDGGSAAKPQGRPQGTLAGNANGRVEGRVEGRVDGKADAKPDGKRGRGGDGKPPPVAVAVVEKADLPERLQLPGTAAALNTAVVRPRVDGVLQSVLFREGDRVAAGDILAQIDPQPFEVAVRSAEGVVERDRALLRNAELDLQRFEDLWAKESVSRQQLDTQRALVQQLRATVQTGVAALDAARLNLSYTRIRAPIAGRLGLRQIDAGNAVRVSDANGLVSITQDDPMAVIFALPDSHVAQVQSALRAGRNFELQAYDRSGQTLLATGRLQGVDNAIDPATGTLRLKGVFPNRQQSLFPNQFVSVRMQLSVRRGVLLVPVSAVQRGADGSFVLLVDEQGSVVLKKVQTGLSDGDRVEVQGDIKPGDRVIREGLDRLRPGSRVEVVDGGKPEGERGANGKPEGARSDNGKPDGEKPDGRKRP